jgi:hypothetical protein
VSIIEILDDLELFTFSDEAKAQVEAFGGEYAPIIERNGLDTGYVLEFLRATAAEAALIGRFGAENIIGERPIAVEKEAMDLAITKTDCSPTNLDHKGRFQDLMPDMFLFSGDFAKVEAILSEPNLETLYSDFDTVIERLEASYAESMTTIGALVSRNASVRVQGLLWKMKLELGREPDRLEATAKEYGRRFGLA